MDAERWLSFLEAATLIAGLPGPGVANVTGYAVSSGRRAAVAAIGGAAIGSMIAMGLSLIGTASLLRAFPRIAVTLEIAGGLYLMLIGAMAIADTGDPSQGSPNTRSSVAPNTAFHASLAVSALNPKSIAFFFSFLPTFIDPRAPFVPQMAILCITFALIVATTDAMYVSFALRVSAWLESPHAAMQVRRASGIIMVAIGAAIILRS